MSDRVNCPVCGQPDNCGDCTHEGRWLIQVGKDKGSYKTRWSIDDEGQAWLYYSSINIGNGYKKRLVAPEGGIVARSYS